MPLDLRLINIRIKVPPKVEYECEMKSVLYKKAKTKGSK